MYNIAQFTLVLLVVLLKLNYYTIVHLDYYYLLLILLLDNIRDSNFAIDEFIMEQRARVGF